MHYLKFTINTQPNEEYISDLLAADLGNLGFESFERVGEALIAYIKAEDYSEKQFKQVIDGFEYAASISFTYEKIEQENWNEVWEKHFFDPILIGDECLIHSSFHDKLPTAKYEIIINPKMSFGTGHHETTSLMIKEILAIDFKDKKVLDMGCGTSVLAILAAKKGAKDVTAIDIDSWCVENSLENILINDTADIVVKHGDADMIEGEVYDVILANINRNILLQDMKKYAASLTTGSILLLSGFYVDDIPIIEEAAKAQHLSKLSFQSKNNWAVLKLIKE